ncbi:HD domain-containing protein [Candidatus Dojkabacteria bacterium]|nr:HD domain-containing protein [Candidatus Dojkabacteria bacterium]
MTINEVYKRYQTPSALVTHMLRVGALSQIILDHWISRDLNKSAIITASLLHDIAKPITFDPQKQSKFGMSPAQIEDLISFQK